MLYLGIKFAFASHEGNTISFKSLYSLPNEAQDQINKILKKIFGQVLARFYTRCREERFDLLAKYEFDGKVSASQIRAHPQLFGHFFT
jgi:hypothetical protein